MAEKPKRKPGRINRRFYPRDAVLNKTELAVALHTSPRMVGRMGLPCFYLGDRSPRYLWSQVLDDLAARAKQGAA
jgi:hypothetical protein